MSGRALAVGALLAALGASAAACGAEVPAGGVRVAGEGSAAPPPETHGPGADTTSKPLSGDRRIEPEELLPGDLDFTVRISLLRMRESMGPAIRGFLGDLESEPLLAKAIEHARSVTVSLRVSDLEIGDRVIAVEGELAGLVPDEKLYEPERRSNDRMRFWVRKRDVMRDETAGIIALDERALLFVSPVELDSVRRVIDHGPDKDRPDPSAEGFVSLEYRPRKLSPSLTRKYPSIARLIGELSSVRGTIEVSDQGVLADVMITARDDDGATRAAKFIDILRTNSDDEGVSKLLRGMDAELTGTAVHVKWLIPAEEVLRALRPEGSKEKPGAAEKPTPQEPPTAPPRTDG